MKLRLRACWTTQAPDGFGVHPARWTRLLSSYLKEIRGQQQISYKDTPNDPIHVHNNQRFITNSMEPGPVS